MPYSYQLRSLFSKARDKKEHYLIVSMDKQIKAWRKANRKMSWGIKEEEFGEVQPPPVITEDDRRYGSMGAVLFYGFGDNNSGGADAVLSGKVVWEYALRRGKGEIWQCEYVHLDETDYTDYIRLRPGAPARPKGFYWAKFQPGEEYKDFTVSQVRRLFDEYTGCGPEGIQFLVVTHPHFADLMNRRKIPFMALADYDVAPYGYEDFYDAPQLFCSNGILGLGIGNIDRDYPLFGIPTVRF
ncbi:MAG: hypothetical protein P8175_17375 [Deltaproteobacteria bacterium]|jgi:hypothetical protein